MIGLYYLHSLVVVTKLLVQCMKHIADNVCVNLTFANPSARTHRAVPQSHNVRLFYMGHQEPSFQVAEFVYECMDGESEGRSHVRTILLINIRR